MARAWTVGIVAVLALGLVGCPPSAEPEEKPGEVTIKVPVPPKKPAVTPPPKPAVKPAPKPPVKPAVKPAPKPVVKPAPKPVVKPTPKPPVKPAVKPTPKPPAPKAALKELKGGLVAVDLTKVFNSDGITGDADRSDADFDEWKQSFPDDQLPKAGTYEPKGVKTAFLFPSKEPKKKNNVACAGQTILLSGKAKALHFLVAATDANQEERVAIAYADGKVQADLKVSDWCQKPAFGEKEAIACTHRVTVDPDGQGILTKEPMKCRIWVVEIPLDAKRELKSIKLPYNSRIHIFSLTLAK